MSFKIIYIKTMFTEYYKKLVNTNKHILKKLKSLSYTLSDTSLSMNIPFTVTIFMFSDDSTFYTKNSIVTITSEEIKGITTINTDTGNADFQIFFSTPGTYLITAICESVSLDFNVIINPNIIKAQEFIPVIQN